MQQDRPEVPPSPCSIYFQIFITFLTVITLLLYDIKTIVFSKNEDFAIGILNCIFCAVFLA
jgi:hypothetical protein